MSKDNHRKFSPSGLQAYQACTKFTYKEMDNAGDSEESPAERGTRLHKATELGDLSLCETQEEIDQVEAALQYVQGLIDGAGEGAQVLREEHIEVPGCDGGTLDFAVIRADGTASLLDHKYIQVPSVVAPEDNLQIQTYCVGLLLKYETLTSVAGTFFAPALMHAPAPVIVTRDDIPGILEKVAALRERYDDPFAAPVPNEYCSKCGNAARCPAMSQVATIVGAPVVYDLTQLPIPADFAADQAVSPRDRGIAHILANALANWAEQVKKANNEASKQGAEVVGHRVIKRAGGVNIPDYLALFNSLENAPDGLALTKTEVLDAVSTTTTKLASVLSVKYGLTAKEAKANLVAWLLSENLVEQKPLIVYLQRVAGQDMKKLLGA